MAEYERVVEIEGLDRESPSLSLRSFFTISWRLARLTWRDTVLMRRERKVDVDRFLTITYHSRVALARTLRE